MSCRPPPRPGPPRQAPPQVDGARTRTPMGCCASTSRRAPTSARTARTILRPWRWPSTAGRERPWAGGHRPRLWTSSFDQLTEAVLRRPLESTVYASISERHPEAAIIVPPRSTAVPSHTAESAPTQRDRHLQLIAERGRRVWQRASGYTQRARAETAIGRWKRVIGDGLRSYTDERRATEMDVAVHVLNRMLELGRPSYVRIA